MFWNWQLPTWPMFIYNPQSILEIEREFLLNVGRGFAMIKSIKENEYEPFVIEILSQEGVSSSRIEGEILDRESVQSSIKAHFGLKSAKKADNNKETRMAEVLCSVYDSFHLPLSHQILWEWHGKLFKDQLHIEDCGKYRTHHEPMQIISNRGGTSKVFFEAPPSAKVHSEMQSLIDWFNLSLGSQFILERASVAHLYFESIHPFEDGNGRIGRLLVEKALSQGVGQPIIIAVSKILEKRKKDYYAALERCNRTLSIDHWMEFFSNAIVQAQKESLELLHFLIDKTKMMTALSDQLNSRQEKVLLRIFAEGPTGFKGGLSAENYLSITKTSKATATRDLMDLVQKKALIKTGELRHSRYWLNRKWP